MSDRLAVEVCVFVEMLGEFLLLRFGEQWFFAEITEREKFVFAAVKIFFVPNSDGFLIDEQGFGDLRDAPSATKKDDGFDAIRLLAVTLKSMQRLERSDLSGCQLKVVHDGSPFGVSVRTI